MATVYTFDSAELSVNGMKFEPLRVDFSGFPRERTRGEQTFSAHLEAATKEVRRRIHSVELHTGVPMNGRLVTDESDCTQAYVVYSPARKVTTEERECIAALESCGVRFENVEVE